MSIFAQQTRIYTELVPLRLIVCNCIFVVCSFYVFSLPFIYLINKQFLLAFLTDFCLQSLFLNFQNIFNESLSKISFLLTCYNSGSL